MINNVLLVAGVQQSDSVIHIHISILFQVLFPFRLLQNIEQSSLCYTVGPCWLSILFYFIYLYKLIHLFIYFWLCWVFVSACRLSLVAARGGYSLLRCVVFSLRWPLLMQRTGSRHAGCSSCGMQAQ